MFLLILIDEMAPISRHRHPYLCIDGGVLPENQI